MLADVLTDDEIILKDEVPDWEEAIRFVAQPLKQKGIIDEEYVSAMIHMVKEYGPYIVIGKHIALAHARPEDGANSLGVSIMQIKKGVKFHHDENDPVRLLFCLSAKDSYSHLNIMKEIVQLIHDERKVEKLSKVKTVKEFKQILFDEE